MKLVGLIPAAGKGLRAYPYTEFVPKCLLEVDGSPLLCRLVEIMRDQLGIDEIYIVTGHHGDRIREYLGDGARFGVRTHFIENEQLALDLPYSIYLGARQIDGPCCVLLSDECYIESNHRDLLASADPDAVATIGLVRSESPYQARKNYSVAVAKDGSVSELIEKPREVEDPWMGVGTYLLKPEVLKRLVADFEAGPERRPADWTTWLSQLAASGERVVPFRLSGRYVNINDREALNFANHVVRDADFESRTAGLVFVVDDAEDDVEEPVKRFAEAPELAEVIVTTRRNSPALEALARNPKVRVMIHGDPAVPVGILLRGALDAATSDILLTAYSDDTFSERDIAKLLVYLRDADLVVGTRTTRQMIEQGTNMRGIVRFAHIALAKVMEILWWRFDSRFTDVCCVYRAIWRSTYLSIRDELRSPGVEVFPEMVIEVLRARRRIIEIPVNYYARQSEDGTVHSPYQTVGTFVRILTMMLRKRFFTRAARERRVAPAEVGADV